MLRKLSFENGKYVLCHDTETGEIICYQHDLRWQDFTGSKFMYILFDDMYNLRSKNIDHMLEELVNKITRDGGFTWSSLGVKASFEYAVAILKCTFERVGAQYKRITELEAKIKRQLNAFAKVNDEICQTLGKVLGYPWYKDDQKNFSGATEADGICQGENIAECMAIEAAKRIKKLESQVISVAYVTEVPTVKQGVPSHEVEDVLEASTVEAWLKQLEMLQSGNSFYSDQIGKQ